MTGLVARLRAGGFWRDGALRLALVALATGALWEPGAQASALIRANLVRAAPAVFEPALRDILQSAPARADLQIVGWDGVDVDGDGASDFANPTGAAPRGHDSYGSGAFGASRDSGVRHHEGVDYVAEAGQWVGSPISGFVTKIGYAYPGDIALQFVEVSNPALGYVARVFYLDPTVAVGQAVSLGGPIGRMHSLQDRYPGGMTDHVHVEIARAGERIDPASVILARYGTPDRG